jgi:hypothetical protein
LLVSNVTISLTKYEWERRDICAVGDFVSHVVLTGSQWWGVKVYAQRSTCVQARDRQSSAARQGVAPPTGQLVWVMVPGLKRRHHGYLMAVPDRVGEGVGDAHRRHCQRLLQHAFSQDDLDRFWDPSKKSNFGWWMGSPVYLDYD